jgi:hypothetical protein
MRRSIVLVASVIALALGAGPAAADTGWGNGGGKRCDSGGTVHVDVNVAVADGSYGASQTVDPSHAPGGGWKDGGRFQDHGSKDCRETEGDHQKKDYGNDGGYGRESVRDGYAGYDRRRDGCHKSGHKADDGDRRKKDDGDREVSDGHEGRSHDGYERNRGDDWRKHDYCDRRDDNWVEGGERTTS